MRPEMQYILAGVATVVVLWPQIYALVKKVKVPAIVPPSVVSGGVSYQESMLALAEVRKRLEQTGGIPQDASHAIEVITHALVEGSGK